MDSISRLQSGQTHDINQNTNSQNTNMDMNDMIRQRAEVAEKLGKMSVQNATLETDFSNPTVFDVAKMKEK